MDENTNEVLGTEESKAVEEHSEEESPDTNMDEDGYINIDYPFHTAVGTIVRHLTSRTFVDHKLYKTTVNGVVLKSDEVSLNTYSMEKYQMTYLDALTAIEAGDESISMSVDPPEDMKPTDKDNRLIKLGHTIVNEKFWNVYDTFVLHATRGRYKGYEVQEILPIVGIINKNVKVKPAVDRFVKTTLMDDEEYIQYKLETVKSLIPMNKADEFERCYREYKE